VKKAGRKEVGKGEKRREKKNSERKDLWEPVLCPRGSYNLSAKKRKKRGERKAASEENKRELPFMRIAKPFLFLLSSLQ
jgi:hypothetical protein